MIASIEGLVAPSMFFCLDHSVLDGDSANWGKGLGDVTPLGGMSLIVFSFTDCKGLFDGTGALTGEVGTSRPSVDRDRIVEAVAKILNENICCNDENVGNRVCTGTGAVRSARVALRAASSSAFCLIACARSCSKRAFSRA